jgi:hypothetical protein
MMKAIAPVLALALFAIAPSAALADTVRFRHDHGYSKLIENAGSVGTTPSNSVPWTSIAVALAIVAAAVLLLTLHLTRRTHRTVPFSK